MSTLNNHIVRAAFLKKMISFINTKRHHIYQLVIETNSKQLKMSIGSSTQISRVRQSFSLRLPMVSIYFNPAVLNDSALSLYGVINRTDLVVTWTPKGEPYFQAFIHYHVWYDTPEVALFQEEVSNRSIHVVLPQGIGSVYENTSPERFFLSSLKVQQFHTPEVDADFEEFWDETVLNGYLVDTLTQSIAEEYCEFCEFIEQQNEIATESEHQDRINIWTPEEAGVLDNNGKYNGKYDINWYPGYTPMSSPSNHADTDLKLDPLKLNEMSDDQYCIIDPKDITNNDYDSDWMKLKSNCCYPVAVKTTPGMYKVLTNNLNDIPCLRREPAVPMLCLDDYMLCLDDYIPNQSKMTLDELAY